MSNLFTDYYDAWNRLDLEGVLSFLTDDIAFEDTTLGTVVDGIARMRRFV